MRRKLEKYEIEEEIGHGGMATVYRAHDTVLDRPVALKVMHPHLQSAEEARQRFQREARSVARLRHPRVLEIYDFSGEGSDESYIAMEMLTGPTLKRWREQQESVPAEIAACMTIEIARALEAAHAASIVHRDVKPENVLLHEARTLKLTDFGIADMMDTHSMTATGQILGSPGHMAPEQIEGKDTDQRTDLFSLGTVLYYLATGRLPFTGRNPHQILKRIVDGEYADPLRVAPAIGGELRDIIAKTLERDPADRFQSAAELRETLEAFVAKIGIDDPAATLAAYLQDPRTVGDDLTRRAVDALIDEGSRASDAGDVPTALDRYNRVLALDEGNTRVLKLIERVGMDRRRRMIAMAGLGLCAVGLATGGLAWAFWPGEPAADPRALAATDGGVAAATVAEGEDAGASVAEGDAGASADSEAPADVGAPADAGAPAADAGSARVAVVRPPLARTREILIIPSIANVTINVDGAPIAGRTAQVMAGRPHTVTLIPGARVQDSYRSTNETRSVPPGDGAYEWPVAVELQDAPLYVDTGGVAGTVTVEGGRGSGRTNSILYVRLRRELESPQIRVRAPGYVDFTDRVDLRAGGETVRVVAQMQRSGVAEAP